MEDTATSLAREACRLAMEAQAKASELMIELRRKGLSASALDSAIYSLTEANAELIWLAEQLQERARMGKVAA